jgi:hypothetical protein
LGIKESLSNLPPWRTQTINSYNLSYALQQPLRFLFLFCNVEIPSLI